MTVITVPCIAKDEQLYLSKKKDGSVDIYMRHMLNETSIEDIANMTISCNYEDFKKAVEKLKEMEVI